ncbi:MAG: hypothetical protein AAGG81_00685 [Chlamydiota bacterium]
MSVDYGYNAPDIDYSEKNGLTIYHCHYSSRDKWTSVYYGNCTDKEKQKEIDRIECCIKFLKDTLAARKKDNSEKGLQLKGSIPAQILADEKVLNQYRSNCVLL